MSKRHIGILSTLIAGAILAVCAGAQTAVAQPAPQIAGYAAPPGPSVTQPELDPAGRGSEVGPAVQ